jgi:probable HAF family extracellular repeat protein
MASPARPNRGRRLRLAVAGAAVLTALTVTTAMASPLTPMGDQTPAMTRPGASPSQDPNVSSLSPGFLLDRGRYSTIEAPGATEETAAVGINNRGQIVGTARGGGQPDRGFVRDPRGRYTTIRYPGARSTGASKINDRGQITGGFSLTADDPRAEGLTGFLLDRGRYTKLAYPGAVTTTAVGVNNRGQVVGEYRDAGGRIHGYVWQRGRFTTIDAPGAAATSLTDINDRGQLVGARVEPDGTGRGFVLERGRYTVFAAPGAGVTAPFDINNRGQIAGFTARDFATPAFQGFLLANGPKGSFSPVNFPGAPSTLVLGLNDRGQITGTYNNPNTTPSPPPAPTRSMGRMA